MAKVPSYDLRSDLRVALLNNDRDEFAELQGGKEVAWAIVPSDEATAITAGTNKYRIRAPYRFKLTEARMSVNTAPTGAALLVDVNVETVSVFSTNKLRIDVSERTSETSSAPPVIANPKILKDAEISIDFDQVGSTVAGAGVKIWLIGTRY